MPDLPRALLGVFEPGAEVQYRSAFVIEPADEEFARLSFRLDLVCWYQVWFVVATLKIKMQFGFSMEAQ